MTKDEALKLALEALDGLSEPYDVLKAQEAIREALAQPEQEPVAWRYRSVSPFVGKDGTYKVSDGWTLIRKPEKRDAHSAMCGMEAEPLYTTPPHRKPLTDVEIWNTYKNLWMFHPAEEPRLAGDVLKFARAIEAKLKEKNT